MFILTFNRSKSKKFQHALNHAASLGATYDGETVRLEVPTSDLLYLYPKMIPLLKIVQHWTHTTATYNGRRVATVNFIFRIWHEVRVCSQQRRDGPEDRHCWQTNDLPGWGCHKINKLFRYNRGTGEYVKSNRYWYNYGEFDDTGLWHINKRLIYKILMKQVREKAIDSCPYFCNKRLWELIHDLPEIIRVDNANYQLHYIKEYEGGRKVLKPVNVRHLQRFVIDTEKEFIPKLGSRFFRN